LTRSTIRRLFLLSALPLAGFLLFAIGGVLLVVTGSHNGSPLECSGTFAPGTQPPNCGNHSYVPAIVLLVAGIVVLIGGGMLASYYAASRIGLPLATALTRRRGQPNSTESPLSPPGA
jgi:hypothetical protein